MGRSVLTINCSLTYVDGTIDEQHGGREDGSREVAQRAQKRTGQHAQDQHKSQVEPYCKIC
jgi:hypothetical protein